MEHKQRLEFLDIAKGIAMILVVMSHSKEQFPFLVNQILSFYVPVFFVAAGFTYHNKRRSVGENIRRRMKQLLLPYFVWNILLYVIWLLGTEVKTVQGLLQPIGGILYSRYSLFPLEQINNVFFLTINNHPLWFLTSMMISSILFFGFVEKGVKNLRNYLVCSLICFGMTALMQRLPILLPWSIDTAGICAWFMITGAGLRKLFEEKQHKEKKYQLLFVPICVIWYCLTLVNDGSNLSVRYYGARGYISIILCAIAGILGSILLFVVSELLLKLRVAKVFQVIGNNTIVIMALHVCILSRLETTIEAFALNGNRYVTGLLYIAKIAISVGLCIIFKKIYNSIGNKIQKWVMNHK